MVNFKKLFKGAKIVKGERFYPERILLEQNYSIVTDGKIMVKITDESVDLKHKVFIDPDTAVKIKDINWNIEEEDDKITLKADNNINYVIPYTEVNYPMWENIYQNNPVEQYPVKFSVNIETLKQLLSLCEKNNNKIIFLMKDSETPLFFMLDDNKTEGYVYLQKEK